MASVGPGGGGGASTMAIPQSGAPAPSGRTVSASDIQKLLEENEEIISAVVEKQRTGQIGECREFLRRLHSNLAFLAACADNQSDGKGGGGGAAGAGGAAAAAAAAAARQQHQQQQQQQQQQPGVSGPMSASAAPNRDQSWHSDLALSGGGAPARHNGGGVKPTPLPGSFPTSGMHMNVNGNSAAAAAATAKRPATKPLKWSDDEHRLCLRLYEEKGKNYKEISEMMGTRSVTQVRSHLQKYFTKQRKDNEARGGGGTPPVPSPAGNGAPMPPQGYGGGGPGVPSSRGMPPYSTSMPPSSRGGDTGMHGMHPQSQVQQPYHGMGGMTPPGPSPYGMPPHMGGGNGGPPPSSSAVGYNRVSSHSSSGMGQSRMPHYPPNPMQDMGSGGMGNPPSSYPNMGGPNGQMNSNG